MVSCQWRLTTGPRAGKACGRGKNVFCKTHEAKAEQTLARFRMNLILRNYLRDKFSYQLADIMKSDKSGAYDYSNSWIHDNEWFQRGSPIQRLDAITDPAIISAWLEQILSKSTIRNGQIFPPPITRKQLNALYTLSNTFRQRVKIAGNWSPVVRNDQIVIPLPLFQRNSIYYRSYEHEQRAYNESFALFLQRCIGYSPDYQALWNWFFPKYSRQVEAALNEQLKIRFYDVEAIEKDLGNLLNAYSTDLQQAHDEEVNNRYRQGNENPNYSRYRRGQ